MAGLRFSKQVKQTDLGSRFSWPTGRLHLLPPFVLSASGVRKVQFEAYNANGRAWPLTCCVRRTGRYLKPELTGSSWLPFVKKKGISVGDLVVFYHDPMGFQIRVRKLKKFKLLGFPITAYAAEE